MADAVNNPLEPLVKAWLQKLKLAQDFKRENFQKDADTAMKFFKCGRELNDLLWKDRLRRDPAEGDDEQLPSPRFRILIGKVAELVQLFGPSLYHRNPTIIAEPKNLDLPLDLLMDLTPPELLQQAQMAAQQQGQQFNPQSLYPPDPAESANRVVSLLLQYALDYIQRENDKKTHSRRMIDEALIKGAGILWTEQCTPYENGPNLVGSFYDTIDNLLIDPDVDVVEDAQWIARRCRHPVWQVAQEYEINEEYLSKRYANQESLDNLADTVRDPTYTRSRAVGETNDLIEYWKIYSKMGMGNKLSQVNGLDDLEDMLNGFGQNCLIVVAEKVPFPLNLHRKMIKATQHKNPDKAEEAKDKAFMSVQWPIPFWADGQWPCTMLSFRDVPNCPWPMSHIKPGLGHLEFLTWCMSFLVNKIRTVCQTVASTQKAVSEEIKGELFSGKDFRLLEIPNNIGPDGDVSKIVHFLEFPPFHEGIWKVMEAEFDLFDKATGLTELAYGASGGMRSAAEVQVKEGNRSVRPDDMASKVEDCMSLIARKEAMALRWLWGEEEVFQVLGQRGGQLWMQYVASKDIDKVAREFHYRVEAGSTRKPNKETRVAQITQAVQQWAPLIQYCLQTGNTGTPNAFLKDWCVAMDMESKNYLLPPPPPPPPNPEMMKVQAAIQEGQAKLQMKQQEFGLKQQEHAAKMQMEQQKLGMQLQAQQVKSQMDAQTAQVKAQTEVQKAGLGMQLEQAKAGNEMQLQRMSLMGDMAANQQQMQMDAAQREQEMRQSQHEHALGMAQSAVESEHKMQMEKQAAKANPAAPKKPAAKKKPKGKK